MISGFVYCDDNNDGIQETGEVGLAGVTVTLTGTNDQGAITPISVLTNADGSYSFGDLRPGTYTVTETTQPAGKLDGKETAGSTGGNTTVNEVISGVTVGSGQTSAGNNFGEIKPGSISGFVYCDTNNDGVKDGGELGLGGVTVTLTGSNDQGAITPISVLTNADGSYSFGDLRPGTYTVTETTQPAGKLDGQDTAGAIGGGTAGNDVISNITLGSGTNSTDNNFGELKAAAIGNRVWVDTDKDGLQTTGEPGVAGVKVFLLDALGNQLGGPQTTDSNGNYLFSNLTPGDYSIRFDLSTLPAGYAVTTRDAGGNTLTSDLIDSDADVGTGRTVVTTLESGETDLSWDMGIQAQVGIDIEKYVRGRYLHEHTGVGDEGLTPGYWKNHSIYGNSSSREGWAETGYTADQKYETIFGVDVPGTPNLFQALSAGGGGINALMRHSTAALLNASNPNVDYFYTKAQVIAMTQAAIASGQLEATKDLFAVKNELGADLNTPATSTVGTWIETPDYDADLPDGPSIPVGGQAIFTYVVTNTGSVALGNILVSDNKLANLVFVGGDTNHDGKLDVSETWTYTATQAITAAGQYTNTGTALGTDAVSGVTVMDRDDANFITGAVGQSLGDRVWLDLNGNGLQDAGEAGVAGVTLQLRTTAGAVLQTTMTDADGDYQFDVAAGSYQVSIVLPTGYLLTGKNAGADISIDSDFDQVTGYSNVVTVNAGQNILTVDAGLYQAASLGDRVWLDSNGNGQLDGAEAGVAGVTVRLLDTSGATVASTTTNSSGNYLFSSLKPGTYAVQFVAPSGYSFTGKDIGSDTSDSDADTVTGKTGNYTLLSGETNLTVDAGLRQALASIGDRVWHDLNANGVQDNGESGISGVTVKLLSGSTVVQTTTTNSAGNYLFNVAAGTYSVSFVTPDGYVITSKDAGGNTSASDQTDSDISTSGVTGTYTVAAGSSNTTVDAGYYKTAAIGDRVWLDTNRNGVQDSGEVGVAGVTVKLLNAAGAVQATQVTDANGNYLFSSLVPGSYSVAFTPLAGYKFTTQDAGGNDGADSDVDASGKTAAVTLSSGQTDRSVDAGLTADCRLVSFDFSGNSGTSGTHGNSRSWTDALTGVSVTARAFSQDKGSNNWQAAWLGAYGGGLGVTDSTEGTGSGDMHTVDNIGRNNYIVLQFSQAVTVDKAYLGYVVNDSDLQIWIGNAAAPITTMNNSVLAGMSFTEVDATDSSSARWADFNANNALGNVLIIAADTTDLSPEDRFKLEHLVLCAADVAPPVAKASIGNFVWEDANYNGIQDAGEKGVANVTVNLRNSAGTVVASTTTDANGQYLFSNLNPASYSVQVVAPSGYLATKRDVGSNDNIDSDIDSAGNTVVTALVAGQNDTRWDAGLYRKASVGDKVWEDKNHNFLQDIGEAGIANIKIKLYGAGLDGAVGTSDDVLVASTTTNSAGNYSFGNLDPGQYRLQFDKSNVTYAGVNMNTWYWAGKDQGSNDTTDSDVGTVGVRILTNVTFTDAFTLVSGQNDLTRDAGITPIVIDLDGDGIRTTSLAAAGGSFDLFGNGSAIQSGWIAAGEAFLAVDKNGNGKIDSIGELFGGNAKGAGFAQLAAYDSNGDGVVDANDSAFADLRVWRDANGNHQTDAGELMTLAEAGVRSLNAGFVELPFLDRQGNLHLERSSATMADGRVADMTDVYFNVSVDDANAAGVQLPTMAELLGDDRSLDTVLGGNTGMAAPAAAADAGNDQSGHDNAEMLRRLAALSREDSHSMPAM